MVRNHWRWPSLLETVQAFQFVNDHYSENADWFWKTDYDTHILLDNLRWLLSKCDPEEPIDFGKRYLLNNEALKRFDPGSFWYRNSNYDSFVQPWLLFILQFVFLTLYRIKFAYLMYDYLGSNLPFLRKQ